MDKYWKRYFVISFVFVIGFMVGGVAVGGLLLGSPYGTTATLYKLHPDFKAQVLANKSQSTQSNH